MPQKGLKMGSFHPFVHPKWSRMRFGKWPATWWFDPFSTLFWSQNSPFSRHFGISGGPKWATTTSKRSKSTCFSVKHGLGSFLVPSESHFEPCSQRYGLFLVCGCRQPIYTKFGASGGLFGPFPGHIMELEGHKELVDTEKSSRT